ncbi:alpha/beta hydrolase [Acidovorax sp. LjRoot118]|uniref:alpha/beta fold hydrolase n=1 Tax=Acidovorax sp. LjRoot118 TaxID=3342256 RepID=UPI003ECF6ADB
MALQQQQPSQILFLPGVGSDPQFWQPVSSLLDHPATRRLMGWPGFGPVPADPGVRGMADLVARVVDAIDRPTALVAQSMGGIVAIQAALQRPDQVTHLVLAATSGGVDMSAHGAQDWRPAFTQAHPTVPRWFADSREDLTGAMADVAAPTLLLWGDADPISPLSVGQRLQALLPHSWLQVVPGGAHDLANRHAAQVAPLIAVHLRGGH